MDKIKQKNNTISKLEVSPSSWYGNLNYKILSIPVFQGNVIFSVNSRSLIPYRKKQFLH
jgi:hypothetical protein